MDKKQLSEYMRKIGAKGRKKRWSNSTPVERALHGLKMVMATKRMKKKDIPS